MPTGSMLGSPSIYYLCFVHKETKTREAKGEPHLTAVDLRCFCMCRAPAREVTNVRRKGGDEVRMERVCINNAIVVMLTMA